MKKMTKLFLISVFSILLITGCGCSKKDKNVVDNEDANTEIKDQNVEGLDIIDFVVVLENNISEVYFEIENNTEETKTFNNVECSLYNKDGEIIYSFVKELGSLEPANSKSITYKVDIDLTSVANVEYVLE